MYFIIKDSGPRVSRSDPATHPDYMRAVEAGKRNWAKMKFENEAQKRDYLRQVESNPHNVVGLPPFYPPDIPREFVSMENRDLTDEEKLANFRQNSARKMDLFCTTCNQVQSHIVGVDHSFCQKCGTQKGWRLPLSHNK